MPETIQELRRKAALKYDTTPITDQDLGALGYLDKSLIEYDVIDDNEIRNMLDIDAPQLYEKRTTKPMNLLSFTAEESDFIDMAEDRHGDLGFTFTEDEKGHVYGQDWVRVTSPDGNHYVDIGTDYYKDSDGAKAAKRKYDKFIRDHTNWANVEGGEFMEVVEDIDGKRQTIDWEGVQYSYGEMFDIYNDKAGWNYSGFEELRDDYWDLKHEAERLDKLGLELNEEDEKEFQRISGQIGDFGEWLDDNTIHKITQKGNPMLGTIPAGRALRETARTIEQMDEGQAVGMINVNDILGKGFVALETGFMHDAIEVRHAKYNDGKPIYINLQATRTGVFFGRDTKAENVNKLMEMYAFSNPNIGIFADPKLQKETLQSYGEYGQIKDLDKIQEFVSQGYTQLEAERKSADVFANFQKRNSVFSQLFMPTDNLNSWQVSFSSPRLGKALEYTTVDRDMLEGTNWEVRREKQSGKNYHNLFLYHKLDGVWTKVDLPSSMEDSRTTYQQMSKYLYDHATVQDIEDMYANNVKYGGKAIEKINNAVAENIDVTDLEALNNYVDSGIAVARLKEDLKQAGLSDVGIIEVEAFINGGDYAIAFGERSMQGMDQFGIQTAAIKWAIEDPMRDWKISKFGNLSSLVEVMSAKDGEILKDVLEDRKGFYDEDGEWVPGTFQRGVERSKLQLVQSDTRIWSEQVFEDLSTRDQTLLLRLAEYESIDAENQAYVLENYSTQAFEALKLQYNDSADIIKNIIERASEDGVEIEFLNNDITNGWEVKTSNKKLKDKYNRQLEGVEKKIKGLNVAADQTEKDFSQKIANWQNKYGGTFELNRIANIDYDHWWQDFGDSFYNTALGIGVLFGSDSAKEEMESMMTAKSLYGETALTWQQAIETGQKWEYVSDTIAEQLPNLLIAIVPYVGKVGRVMSKAAQTTAKISKFIPNVQAWAAPMIFGMTSAGQKRFAVESRMGNALVAREALIDLERNKENMSYDSFVEKKIELEKAIAYGDISSAEKWGSILTTGIIEGTITRYLGTVPNAKALVGAFSKPTSTVASALFRSNWQAAGSALWQTTWRTGFEVLEETSIEFGTALGDHLILNDKFDLSHLDDVAIQSIIMGGGMNAPGSTYSAVMTQMATSEFRKEGLTHVEALKRIEEQMGMLKAEGDETYRKELITQYSTVISEMNFMKNGLEIDAMMVGAENVQKLIQFSYDLNVLNKKAGIKPNDNEGVANKKREQYIKTLTKSEAKNYQGRLDGIKKGQDRIHESINYDGGIEKIFGAKGLQIDQRLKDKKNTSDKAKKYRKADQRGKLVMVLDEVKNQVNNNYVKQANGDPKTKNLVEEEIYSKRDKNGKITKRMNFEQWKKATGKKNRKKALETEMYQWAGSTFLGQVVDSKMLFREGDVSAKSILGEDVAKNLKILQVDNKAELIKAVQESNQSDNNKSQLIEDIESGNANAAIIGSNYIVIGSESFKAASEKLAAGDIMQGTAMSHEISHFIDDAGMTGSELVNYANKLHGFVSEHKNLAAINKLVIRNLIEYGYWKGGEGANFNRQSKRTKDEYIREVQGFLQSSNFTKEYNKVKGEVSQSLMNKLRSVTAGDYVINTNNDAMNYMIAFIENFRNGKISKFAKRKIEMKKKTLAKLHRLAGVKKGDSETAIKKKIATYKKKIGKEKAKEFTKKLKDATTEARKEVVKKSKSASERVQRIYEEKGEAGIMEILDEYAPMVGKLVNKYKNVPGFERQLLIDEINTGERGIYDLVRDYNIESGVPLAAYINKYLSVRAIEAANRILKTEFEGEIDERITDKRFVDEIEDTVIEEDKVSLRKQLNIETDSGVYNSVVQSVVKTFGTKLPDISSNEFKNALTKAFRTELKKTTADLMGTRAKYRNFLEYNWMWIYDGIPQSTINKRFPAFAEPVIDPDTGKQLREKTPQGNRVFTKKNITQEEFLNYFLGEDVGASTRGTRKDALAEELGVEMAFDATMEVIQSPEMIEKRKGLAQLIGQEQAKNEIAIIGKQIDRSPSMKFSRSTGGPVKFVTDSMFLLEEVARIGLDNVFDLDAKLTKDFALKLNKKYAKDIPPATATFLIKELYVKGLVIEEEIGVAITKVLGKGVRGVKGGRGPVYEQAIIDLAGKVPGITVLTDKVAEGGIPDLHIQLHGQDFFVEVKMANARFSSVTINTLNINTFKYLIKKKYKFEAEIERLIKRTKPGFKKLQARLLELGVEFNQMNDPIPAKVYEIVKKEGLINGVTVSTKNLSADIIAELYNTKQYPNYYIQIQGSGLFYLGKNPLNLPVPKLDANVMLTLAPAKNTIYKTVNGVRKNSGNVRLTLRAVPQVIKINSKSDHSVGNLLGWDRLMDTKEVKNLKETNDMFPPVNQIEGGLALDAAVKRSRSVNPKKGITVLDFDDTLATTKSKVLFTAPDGTTGSLNAEQYASTYQDLAEQGYKFDFSEFNVVIKGKIAPLFNKALKLQEKFGTDNMFILTARPQEAQQAIYKFLQAQGLSIPIGNITGLGNSTAEAKALWIAEKVGEGYNDFYFADDALQNVQAVKNMLDQFDVKSKVQQAKVKFSKSLNTKFNQILESTMGVDSKKVFSDAQAKLRGKGKGRFSFIIPPSAQDFLGLLYNFIGKGDLGDQQMKFFKEALIDPFARGINELNSARQSSSDHYKAILKRFPKIRKALNDKFDNGFTLDQAIRVYLWNKAGFKIPGLSKHDTNALVSIVENSSEYKSFAEALGVVSRKKDGYTKPGEYWLIENIPSDLFSDGAIGDARSEFLAEWIQNKNIIFSKENLNKIEAAYGFKLREALEDILYRMESGRNRPTGSGRLVNSYMNWVNNSVGAIMFFNIRSAVLQTISATNYTNWTDNNPLKAAAAFANQPQFWKDFAFIFNSDMLKQRRAGLQYNVNEAELAAAVKGSDNKAKAALAWLLKKGFTPTQIADSFAISSGGATYYRNRVNSLKNKVNEETGKKYTTKEAEKKAWLDFQERTETAQQSARPDLISQQQASPLGRLILAFANTPMQYMRIMNKAARDLVNGRGDTKTHVSKIVYYGAVQAIVFSSLQSALFAVLGDEDEEELDKKKSRILNNMLDTWLVGIGFGGRAISTVKNTMQEYYEQKAKGYTADHAYTIIQALNFSPPIGSKMRKLYNAIQTEKFNSDVMKERGFTLDNPTWSAVGNLIEAVTNIPLGRLAQKMNNIDNALNSNLEMWQRAALILGWNTWDLGIKDPDIVELKMEIKERKKETKKIETKKKKEIKKKEKKEENLQLKEDYEKQQGEEFLEGKGKKLTCSGVTGSGERCKVVIGKRGKCTIHQKVEIRKDGKKSQCKKMKQISKKKKERCKMQTNSKSGYCYYHD